MSIAYIGLGSNLLEPLKQVQLGIQGLAGLPRTELISVSSCYLSPPMGPADQPDFVNAVVKLSTQLSATHLLKRLLDLERLQGRCRENQQHWGPRVIDLDLLLFDDINLTLSLLTLPHPGILHRSFVCIPLLEIEPDLIMPDGTLLKTCASAYDERLVKLEDETLYPKRLEFWYL